MRPAHWTEKACLRKTRSGRAFQISRYESVETVLTGPIKSTYLFVIFQYVETDILMAPKSAPGTPRHFFGALPILYWITGCRAISQFQFGRRRFRFCSPIRKSARSDSKSELKPAEASARPNPRDVIVLTSPCPTRTCPQGRGGSRSKLCLGTLFAA